MALIIGTSGDDNLNGTLDNDFIDGLDGNDIIFAYEGNDLVIAGGGNDGVSGGIGNDNISGRDGNDILEGNEGSDWLKGCSGEDTIYGNDGNDMLDGGAGIDIMLGGKGNDTYFVNNSDDIILEDEVHGIDFIYSSASYLLPAHVENLKLTGNGDINVVGNSLNNHLGGNDGANILVGATGNDWLAGDHGNDSYQGYFSLDFGNDIIRDIGGEDTLDLSTLDDDVIIEYISMDTDQNGYFDSLLINFTETETEILRTTEITLQEADNNESASIFINDYYDNQSDGFGDGYIEHILV